MQFFVIVCKERGFYSFIKFYNTNFLINITPLANTKRIIVPPAIKAIIFSVIPVFIESNTSASSISSSPSTLLSGVESLSGIPLSLSSFDISAIFVFTPKLSSSLIHLNVTFTFALSPGFNNVSDNNSVPIITPSFFSYQPLLSSRLNSNPSGI